MRTLKALAMLVLMIGAGVFVWSLIGHGEVRSTSDWVRANLADGPPGRLTVAGDNMSFRMGQYSVESRVIRDVTVNRDFLVVIAAGGIQVVPIMPLEKVEK